MSTPERRNDWSVLAAVALIAAGVWLLLQNFDNPVFDLVRQALSFAWGVMWPLLLIVAGVLLLIVSRQGHLGSFHVKGSKLYRSRTNRMIGGVLGGLAAYLGIDATWIRIGYVLLGVFTGFPALIVYIIAMIVIPEEPLGGTPPPAPQWPGSQSGTETVQTPPPAPPVPPTPPASNSGE